MNLGHRGANHPVKNLTKGNVEITSQKHGFEVVKKIYLKISKLLINLYLTTALKVLNLNLNQFFQFNIILSQIQDLKTVFIYSKNL